MHARPLLSLAAAAALALPVAPVAELVAQSAPGAAAPTVVVIVRHAEKAAEPTNDPPLTEVGTERAQALALMLRDADVAVVMHTPTVRTRDTARPVAAQFGLTPQVLPLGPSRVHAAAVAEAVRKHPGRTIVVVGHSNTIMPYVEALGGPKRGELCDHNYDGLYTVILDGAKARLVEGRYGPPNPPATTACGAMTPRP